MGRRGHAAHALLKCEHMQKHLLLFVLSTAACAGLETESGDTDLTTPVAQRCDALEGRRFVTVDPQTDCGPAPAGSQLECRWSVSFAASTASATSFVYSFSDVGMSGTAACTGGSVVEIQLDGSPGISGSYEPNTDLLEWDGLEFAPAP